VYPAEVERVLDGIDGVLASAVTGLVDERLGERVFAAVELEERSTVTVDEMAERCARELARYKVPERFVLVDVLPRNAMGKIDRKAVPALFAEPI
jgi:acyl-CoA synthetase (AMP-forming)/AMP-acid ligase II